MIATAELASFGGLQLATRALDLDCGIGGPARDMAATFSCEVIGVDLSQDYIETAS